MNTGQILYQGRYSKQILSIISKTDFVKIKKLMEINGEVWELEPDEVGVPSLKELALKAFELLSKVEADPNKSCIYNYRGLAATKGEGDLGLMYIPIIVAEKI